MSGSGAIPENGQADRYQQSIAALFLEQMIEIIGALEICKQRVAISGLKRCLANFGQQRAGELLVAHLYQTYGVETGV